MYITIVICTYNRSDTIIECLQSLVQCDSSDCDLEILIIDNNSSDGTVQKIQSFILKNSHFNIKLYKEIKQGLSYARNVGIQNAKGDFIFFLDDDAIIDAKCFAVYKFYYERHGYECMGGENFPWLKYDRKF